MRYGLAKRLKRGITVSAMLTFRCNLDCSYCSNKFVTGKMPSSKEMSLIEWIEIFDRFPVKIREVIITGGEPFLYKHIDELILYLVGRNIHVAVFSNLLVKRQLSYTGDLLRIAASHHENVSKEKFNKGLEYYRSQGVRVDYKEYIENSFSEGKFETITDNDCLLEPRFIIAPNGHIMINKKQMLNEYPEVK